MNPLNLSNNCKTLTANVQGNRLNCEIESINIQRHNSIPPQSCITDCLSSKQPYFSSPQCTGLNELCNDNTVNCAENLPTLSSLGLELTQKCRKSQIIAENLFCELKFFLFDEIKGLAKAIHFPPTNGTKQSYVFIQSSLDFQRMTKTHFSSSHFLEK